QAGQRIPAAADLQGQHAALAVAAEVRGGDRAAAFLASPVQCAGQGHGVVAEGADYQKLFTNGRGGHAGFLTQMKTTPEAAKRGRKGSENRRPKEWRHPELRLCEAGADSTIGPLFSWQEWW